MQYGLGRGETVEQLIASYPDQSGHKPEDCYICRKGLSAAIVIQEWDDDDDELPKPRPIRLESCSRFVVVSLPFGVEI